MSLFVSCTIRVGENGADRQAGSQTASEVGGDDEEDHLSFIGAGDKINIQVYNEKELSGIYQVSPEGYITFPFIGEIKV
ncbi:polysaccharide biosynthesis/export family protein, partial [bacterium]|nr:polysaccharide biosynthesis/export family protein [bacterium]